MEIEARLALFLAAESQRPWVRGEHDCGLWLADWYMAATGKPDPASDLRGWTSEDWDIVVLSHVRRIMRAIGLRRTHEAKIGDIAVVEPFGQPRRMIVGAIRGRDGWIMPAENERKIGLTKMRDSELRLIAAWSI